MKNIQIVFLSFIVFAGCNLPNKEADQTSEINQEVETTGPDSGTLLIIGGNQSEIFYTEFMNLIGGKDSPIVVIPTAGLPSDTLIEKASEYYHGVFTNYGFTNVTVLHTSDQEEANSENFVLPIKKAIGIWFTGGRQWRLADAYLNTKAHDAFKDVLKRGGVIAGSSAGATIQGAYLVRGDTKTNTVMMGDHEEGLGFLTNVAIDQHLLALNRQFDMFVILDKRPGLLGIGLDENTGIIVEGARFRVIGESYVAIYDGTRWSEERDTIYQLPKGSREYYLLKSGDEYNLNKRKVITFDGRGFLKLSVKQLVKYVGVYQNFSDSLKLEILIENDSLKVIQGWNKGKYPILPELETRFYINESKIYFDFDIDQNGIVNAFSVPLQNSVWKKTPD